MDDNANIQAAKSALRRQVLEQLKQLKPEEISTLSEQACRRLQEQRAWREAQTIMGFAPMPGELDIWPALVGAMDEGKAVGLLRFQRESGSYAGFQVKCPGDLVPGYFGIREPGVHCARMNLMRLDFVLVPGIAFDLRGRRLGRGKGYYDRVLPAARGVFCGVAFDQQIVRAVPVAPHDASVTCILTPTRWVTSE